MTNDGGYSIISSLQLTLTQSQTSSKAMWSGFFAGILAAISAVVSVIPGWFFNQSGKVSAIRKALQLEVDANWQRLEHLRNAVGAGNPFIIENSSAVVEGTNNNIKTLKRQAYGFRDMIYFKLRLYHLHTQRYSLTG